MRGRLTKPVGSNLEANRVVAKTTEISAGSPTTDRLT